MRNLKDTKTDLRRIITNAEAGYVNDMGEFQEIMANAMLHLLENKK